MHAGLVRCRINHLCRIDRVTGEPIRRYEHDHPGSLIHVDVTKFGNIPDGGGWRYVGKPQGNRNRAATVARTRTPRSRGRAPLLGTSYVHTVIDDHSRVAYAEICRDEKAATATAVLRRAVAWFAEREVTVQRVLSDNGSAYKSHAWREACTQTPPAAKHSQPGCANVRTPGRVRGSARTISASAVADSCDHRTTATGPGETGARVRVGGQVLRLPGAGRRARGLGRAALALDAAAAREVLTDSIAATGAETTWNEVAVPVLTAVGERWAATGAGVEIEHMLSESLQSPPSPQRNRSPAPDRPTDQPGWTSQLADPVFWRRTARALGPDLLLHLDYVGLDAFPDVFRRMPHENLPGAVRFLVETFRRVTTDAGFGPDTPIHVTHHARYELHSPRRHVGQIATRMLVISRFRRADGITRDMSRRHCTSVAGDSRAPRSVIQPAEGVSTPDLDCKDRARRGSQAG